MDLKLLVILSSLLVFGSVDGLKCRSGFNTSAFSIPINFWDESYTCPAGNSQSCFIGQIKYNDALLGSDLDITYGSCVSSAYAPILSCESIFGSDQINIENIINAIPDLSQSLQGVVGNLSVDLAKRIQMYFQNSSQNLNRTEIVLKVLNEFDITIPPNVQRILVKLDRLIDTAAMNNMTLIDTALKELLSSLGNLNTTHPVTDQISHILESLNVTVPDHFKPIFEHLPGFIAQYLNISMGETGNVLMQIISKFNMSNPVSSLEEIVDIVIPLLPPQLNSTVPIIESLPDLVNQLLQNNINYITTWHINLLVSYSRITPATQAVSNSIYTLLQTYRVYDNLTEDMRTLIVYQPGILYAYFPENEALVDSILYNISSAIDSLASSGIMDIQTLLDMFMMNGVNISPYLPIFQELYQSIMTGNGTVIAQTALQALKNVSITTPESVALSQAIIQFIEQIYPSLPEEAKEVIMYFPGLINTVFSNNTDMIGVIFTNIAQELNKINITNPNYADMLNSLLMMSNTSLPAGATSLLETLPNLITAIATNDTMLVGQLLTNWLVKTVGNETEASMQLANAIIGLAVQLPGVAVDSATEMIVSNLVRLPYVYFPDNAAMIDMIYGNISTGIMNVNVSAFDPAALQQIMQNIDLSMVPPQLIPLLNNTDKIIMAIMSNNTAVQIIAALAPSYCQSNDITSAFAQAQLENLNNWGVTVPEELQPLLECLPGIAYNFFPNQTVMDTIFSQITQGTTNITAYVEALFSQFNISTSPQLTILLQNIPNIQQALASGNATVIGMVFQQIGMQLAMAPPDLSLLPPALVPLINSTNDIITAILSNNTVALMEILMTLTPQYCVSNDVTNAFAEALYNDLINRGVEIPIQLKPALECIPGVLYMFLPNQTTTINTVFTQITQATVNLTSYVEEMLAQYNITVPPQLTILLQNMPQIQDAFASGNATVIAMVFQEIGMQLAMAPPDLSIFPPSLVPLINSTNDLIEAILSNDTARLMALLQDLLPEYCITNDITTSFADAFVKDLSMSGIKIPTEYKSLLGCIPGILFKFLPNQTAELTTIFQEVTQAMNNLTSYIENKFEQINQPIPPELVTTLNTLPALRMALADGNITKFVMILQQLGAETARETELSKLIETILVKNGVNVTDEIRVMIQQNSMSLYYGFANYTQMFDIIFSSLNADIAAGKDIGIAIEEAFQKANVPIPPEIMPLLNNLQAIIDAFMNMDQLAIYDATIATLEAYNAVYPSPQLELQINIQQLQRALMVVVVNGTAVPPEVYVYIGNIYNIALNMSGITQDEFKQMLATSFPQLAQVIEFVFLLEPSQVIALGQNFTMWLLDPNRNATTLVPYINTTLHFIVDKLDLNIAEILKQFLQPDICKYNYCLTEKCNTPMILQNVTVVTPAPETTMPNPLMTSTSQMGTTTPKLITTSQMGTTTPSQAPGTGNPNPVTTTLPVTTTSGSGIVVKTATTPLFYVISLIFSVKFAIL